MSSKKGVGSSRNGRDSNPKYLGIKLFAGQTAKAGNIILRQRGSNTDREIMSAWEETLLFLPKLTVLLSL